MKLAMILPVVEGSAGSRRPHLELGFVMSRAFAAVFCFAVVALSSPSWAQDGASMIGASAQADSSSQSITTYNWCKKEAFDYGAIGNYRRLFVLSCLGSDMTAAIPAQD